MLDPETAGTLVVAAGNAANVVKTIVDTIAAARSQVKGDKDADEKLSEVARLAISLQSEILSLQDMAFRLQQERHQLHQQNIQLEDANAKLHQQLREKEEGSAERQKYQPKQAGRSRLLVRDDDPYTFYCPTCFEIKKAAIQLQPVKRGAFGLDYRCNVCGTSFPADSAT